MYQFAKPDDGYAYSPIELTAIWAIPVDVDDIAAARNPIYGFHEYMLTEQDNEALDLLWRDTIAQLRDDELPTPPAHECQDCNRIRVGLDPLEDDGA